MSSEIAKNTIETVRKKLEKYNDAQQNDKVQEYLVKLHNTTITSALIRETRIDELVLKIALNTKASYHIVAKNLLQKWEDKKLLSNKINDSKNRIIKTTEKPIVEKKFPIKRKSNGEDTGHLQQISESQSSDECKDDNRDQSSSIKKRRVLSLAEYVNSKKSMATSSTVVDSTTNELSPSEVEQIYAQFNAKCKELASSAPDIAKNVENKLKQVGKANNGWNIFTTNNQNLKTTINEKAKIDYDDIWAEDDDDEDEDDQHLSAFDAQNKSNMTAKPLPTKRKQTIKYNDLDSQQSKLLPSNFKLTKTSTTAVATTMSNPNAIDHPQPSSNALKLCKTDISKKSDESCNFLRSKHGRQAIYSGNRNFRKNMASLQDLCIETLKENIDDICNKHFYRLPYDVVKPIVDVATPEQLHAIVNNNPDYIDDVEPLWQRHCELHFKDVKRDEFETYYELYLRKHNENEERLQRITELAKKKKAQTVDTARHTRPLTIRQPVNRHAINSTKTTRQAVYVPPSKSNQAQTKTKKRSIPPLLKKTLKAFNGKN